MTLSEIINVITEFARDHQILAIFIVFILAFGESLAFISLLLPATVILLGLGALIGDNGLTFLPIWLAAACGAFLGDWLSYWFGFHYKNSVRHMWPISRRPEMLDRGHLFFERWGVWSVFIGRFFGPLRAVIPLVAGICAMPKHYFQLANLLSAMVWAFAILAPGAFGLSWLAQWMG
ncbi:DedA family protein [Arsenophonus sp. PmNCSU2021_1]|uniref:DedA family protein n=1 Tax=Arsenophonus sp. PmNCSU2021_1 TaxID=3118989 RepID=UPI002FF1E1C9